MQSEALGKCTRKVGDLQAGVLLFDLLLSFYGSTVPRGRKRWVAKSRSEYMRETGLTLEQYKRAAALLRRRGIVEWRQFHREGKPITHMRLTEQAEQWARREDLLTEGVETEQPHDPEMDALVRERQSALGRGEKPGTGGS